MNETRDTLDRAFELMKAPMAGVDFDVSKKRVEELMMSEFSRSQFRSRRRTLLVAVAVLSVVFAGGAVAATTDVFKKVQVFLVGPDGTEHEVQLLSTESGESVGTLILPEGADEVPAGATIELRAAE
jgi:hypothetical protein